MKKTAVKIMACAALLLVACGAKPAMAWDESSDEYNLYDDFANRQEGRDTDGRVYIDAVTGNRVGEPWIDEIPQTPFVIREYDNSDFGDTSSDGDIF